MLDELTLPADDPRVLLNAEVASLRYNATGVTAILRDGREFAGDVAIVTIPLGTLQARHKRLFDPPLSRRQVRALDKCIMANFTKIHMQWRTPFWRDVPRWLIAGDLPAWWNLNHASMLPGSNMLLAWTDGPQGTRYEEMSDAGAKAAALKHLRKVYPNAPEPVAFHITRHGSDPLQLGAYSGWPNGLNRTDWENAHAPLGSRVFFAGEAWCNSVSAYMQGAFLSGQRVVDKWVLPALGRPAGPPSLCDAT